MAWHYFKKLLGQLHQKGLVIFKETELQVQFSNGNWITLAGSENIESYRGIYLDRIVADEMASWRNARYAWFEVLRPAMADRLAKGMIIGTVKGLDMLYEFYMRGISLDPLDDDFASIKLPASVTGIIAPKELAELKRSMSAEAFEREMECNFFAETPEVLITPAEARDAQTRVLTPGQRTASLQSPIIFGLDVGRTGDPSVLYERQGLIITKLFSKVIPDNMKTAARVSRHIKTRGPTSVFVDLGAGQGVIDRLYQLGHDDVVVEVPFNATSPERACVNMRAAMYYRLKKFLSRGTIPDDPELLRELVNQELADDLNNRVKLAPKPKIRERIGRSPNDSDACALLFADDTVDQIDDPEYLKQKAIEQYLRLNGVDYKPSEHYDPLNYMSRDSLYSKKGNEDFLDLLEELW